MDSSPNQSSFNSTNTTDLLGTSPSCSSFDLLLYSTILKDIRFELAGFLLFLARKVLLALIKPSRKLDFYVK